MDQKFGTKANGRVENSTHLPPLPPGEASVERVEPDQKSSRRGPEEEGPYGRVMEVEGVYIISVAARILDMHPQTLRKYERLGLINPVRTVGMLRLYSREDIRKLFLIRHLMDHLGLNLAGVELTLNLVESLLTLEQRLENAATGTPLEGVIEQELSRLFRSLNLPVKN